MFDRILLAIDECGPDELAVSTAAALGRRFGSEVVVLGIPVPGAPADPGVTGEMLGGEAPAIDRVARDLKDRGVSARPELWEAHPDRVAYSVADIARHEGADLIVLGSRDASGRDGSGEPARETLADEVLRLSSRPVLVVP